MKASEVEPMEVSSAYHRRATCRGCGGTDLHCVLELGPQPLANALPAAPSDFVDEPRYPLDLFVCRDCFLVQLLDVVDPAVLFRDYLYVSGTSTTMGEHFAAYARDVMDLQGLGDNDLVVEVASNDGSLLEHFQSAGVRTLGIEPARNVAEMARAKGLETIAEFFDPQTAESVLERYGPARAVMANNVLAHVDDTAGFLSGCRTLLHEDGVLVIEAPYLSDMLDRLEYDTIYHEHLCYFSATAILPLFERSGLSIVRIDHVPVHGGSIRIFAKRRDTVPQHGAAVLGRAEAEAEAGLRELRTYEAFGEAVVRGREELRGLLASLREEGKRLVGYGAPAKGNTLLNYCGIGADVLEYIADRNPLKVGRFTPGTHIPVVEVDRLRVDPPDAVLILAWNFADEILEQLSWLKDRGAVFIVPVPRPRVV